MLKYQFSLEIYSDASTSGWGAVCKGKEVSGFWNSEERLMHINYLELKAAFLAIKCFLSETYDSEVLMRIDNTTAVAYINKMGGIQFPKLNRITREIWQWCERRGIWLYASYIKSADNVADEPSRVKNIDTEWELADYAFQNIIKIFGSAEVDLFASRSNTKYDKYCSRDVDPDCYRIDAFTLSWHKLKFYAFPPFAIILKVLRKIVEDKAVGLMVVPNWPSQVWFPLFKKLIVGKPIYFDPSENLLLSPCRKIQHPLARHLGLIAAKLSGSRI